MAYRCLVRIAFEAEVYKFKDLARDRVSIIIHRTFNALLLDLHVDLLAQLLALQLDHDVDWCAKEVSRHVSPSDSGQ